MSSKDKTIGLFVLVAFISRSPTWFSRLYVSDELAWTIFDYCALIGFSILPLMAAVLVRNRILKIAFVLYFGLTLFNIIDYLLVDNELIEFNLIIYKLLFAGVISFIILCGLIKTEGQYYEW